MAKNGLYFSKLKKKSGAFGAKWMIFNVNSSHSGSLRARVDSVKIPYPIIQETSFVMQYIVVKSGKNGKNWFKNGLKMVFSHIFDGLKMVFFAISDGLFFLEPVGTYES